MSEAQEIWTCSRCGCRQDISQLGFYAEIACTGCGSLAHVHNLLANYKIDSVLGIGGMSVVFKARDLVLGRPLAIKVLNDTYRDAPERIAGFENECSLMAKVRHENVVSVYSAGWARGQFYIAMELVKGRNLELIVAENGPLKPVDALEVIRQVSVGLRAANQAGLLHRDVKPGNVLITPEGQAKVLDFGLSLEDKPGVEQEDIIWATPYYVPPETLQRETESVQTDIYALGMTLRNLLTGEAALPGNPQTLTELLDAKKRLSGISRLLPNLEPSVCELVDQMTAYDRDDRPEDYDEVLELIATAQNDLAQSADPHVRASRYREKLYMACAGLGSLALGVIGAFVVALLTPSGVVQEALSTDSLQWATRDTFMEAEAAMKKGKMSEARALFASLAGVDTESTVAAASALMCTSFDVMRGNSAAVGHRKLMEIIGNGEARLAPCGRAQYEKIKELTKYLYGDADKASSLAEGLENPFLKAAAYLLVADSYVSAGRKEQAEDLLNKATELFTASGASAFNASMDEYRVSLSRRSAHVLLGVMKQRLQKGEFEQAQADIDSLLKQKLTRLEKEEVRVLNEALAIMQVAREMLKRKGVNNLSPTVSPADLQIIATGKGGSEKLPQELRCLAFILRGEYDNAFREDPYAADETSNEPFAVMMRDWKKRLEK